MPILPSTLEYAKTDLEKKVNHIILNINSFLELSKQDQFELHVDLVYPAFAKDRSVLSSINLTSNYKAIESILEVVKSVKLTIHFMGMLDDLRDFNHELNSLVLNPRIICELYIPLNMNKSMILQKGQFENRIYQWIDSDQYNMIGQNKLTKFLLMTVKAGKSGQILTLDKKKEAIDIVEKYKFENVIVDGGWQIDDINNTNLRMVSYSSFWKNFINHLN
jgi:hypothetical protein